jgi:hypothetical protein
MGRSEHVTGFLDRLAARSHGVPVPGTPVVHLRRRSRFEPAPGGRVDLGVASLLPPARSTDAVTEDVDPADPVSGSRPTPTADAVHQATDDAALDGGHQSGREPTSPLTDATEPGPTTQVTAQTALRATDRSTDPAWQEVRPAPQVPDPLAVVREHVVPKLMDTGVLGAMEDVEVIDAHAPHPPLPASVPGRPRVQLRVEVPPRSGTGRREPARGDARASPGSIRMPDVHLHIGRIEVVRPAAPPSPGHPAPAAPARRPAAPVDHAAYLARRRELS